MKKSSRRRRIGKVKSRNLSGAAAAAAASSDNCGGAAKTKAKLAQAGLDESHGESRREREPQHNSRGSAAESFAIVKTSDRRSTLLKIPNSSPGCAAGHQQALCDITIRVSTIKFHADLCYRTTAIVF